ncbi:MAG: hypothetical protein KDC44_22100, partial [Phaeodactylibacter sp.]|nr:hypothetical protein [Phaeodactylibacter sp.]
TVFVGGQEAIYYFPVSAIPDTVSQKIPLPPVPPGWNPRLNPVDICFSPDGKTLYAAGGIGNVAFRMPMVANLASGKIERITLPSGQGTMSGMGLSPDGTRLVFSFGGNIKGVWTFWASILNLSDWDQPKLTTTYVPSAGDVVFSADNSLVYVLDPNGNKIYHFPVANPPERAADSIPVPAPEVMVLDTTSGMVYVGTAAAEVAAFPSIDPPATPSQSWPAGGTTWGIAMVNGGAFGIVGNAFSGTVSIFMTRVADGAVANIAVGNRPASLAISPNGLLAFAGNIEDNTISVLQPLPGLVRQTDGQAMPDVAVEQRSFWEVVQRFLRGVFGG